MSHFSVCVIVPDDGVVNNIHANNLEDHLIPVLAPFDEQTEEEKYREFEDRTEEAKADFENDTMRVVRFPDGSIHSIYDDAFNKFFFVEEDNIYAFGPNRDRKSKLQTEESKALELVTDYPVKSWYPSFEAYCDEHRGFVKASDGRWGYTCNPNAKWDWWQIGGRFPNRFLVPAGLQDCIPSAKDDDGESAIPPEGYQYLKNDADEVIFFAGVEAAKVYLREHGVTEDEMEDMVFRKSVGTCFRCGDPLFLSDIPEYTCQCFRCDEDFYSIEQDVDL